MPISATDLNKAYLAYFGRPADLTGKTYFATLEQADVIKAFDASAESKALYGNDAAAKVNAIYQNLFNRDAEPAGLVYWTTLINQGRVTAAGAAFAILNGAQGTDATAVQNKLAASEAFVAAMDTTAELVGYSGLDAAASARNWLKGVSADPASLTAAVAGAQAAVDAAVAVGTGEGGAGYQLTNGTDVASSNVFTAGLVYTPGGDDRINSLQDEDRLTGTGTDATLNATLGNANDNGGTVITPTLVNISTINAAFTGSGGGGGAGRVDTLDLQDSTGVDTVNITRISEGFGARVQNIAQPAKNLSVKNSQSPNNAVAFTFLGSAVAGTADSTTLTVSNVNTGGIRVEQNAAVPTQGFETINLVSSGSANAVGVLIAEDLATLNISGTQDLRLGGRGVTTGAQGVEAVRYADGLANVNGSLTNINASTFEGKLDLTLGGEFNAGLDNTSGVAVQLTVTGGKADDTIRLVGATIGGTATNTDRINGGEGNNTLVVTGNTTIAAAGTAAAPVANVTNIQALEVRSGHDLATGADTVNVNADAFDKLATIYVRNEGQQFGSIIAGVFVADPTGTVANGFWQSAGEGMTVNLTNLTSAQANAITLAHGTTGNSSMANNVLNANLKSSTNASDTVGVTIVDGVNTDGRFNFNLSTNADLPATATVERVENVTLTDSDTESNTVLLSSAATHTGIITLTGGRAGDFISLDTAGAINDGLVLRAVDGTSADGFATGVINPLTGTSYRETGWNDVFAGSTRLVAATIDASGEAANVVVRVSSTAANPNGGQAITMGAGNDVVIFDDISATSATRGQAGLTNADTVKGGEGSDTLVLDGNGVNVVIQQSEWDNVSGFETIYLAGNGAGNQYLVQLDNDLIAANGVDGTMITIDNDNDSLVNTQLNEFFFAAANADGNAANTAVRLDATTLSANTHFTYDGEEGAGATADRFVVNDQNTNGGNIIDGGDVNVAVGLDATNVLRQLAGVRSNDVLEVRNTATVTTADLTNVRNVGSIVINNDQAVQQTLNLVLNSTVVDALSDSGHTASLTETEALLVTANDGMMQDAAGTALVPVAASRIVLNARAVSGAYGLTVTGDNTAGGAADVIDAGLNFGGAAQTYNMGLGTDTVSLYGFNAAGTDSVAVAVAGNVQTVTAAAAGGLSTQVFTLTSVEELNYLTSAGTAATVTGSTFTGSAGVDTISGSNLNDVITGGAGADILNGGAGNDTFVVAALADFAVGESVAGGAGSPDTLQFGAVGAITYVGSNVTGVEILDLTAGAANAVVVTQGTGLNTVLDLGVVGATLTLNQGAAAFGAAAQATAAAVDVAGEWHYAAGANNGTLTYFDQTVGAAVAISLVGVETGALTGGVASAGGNLVFTQA